MFYNKRCKWRIIQKIANNSEIIINQKYEEDEMDFAHKETREIRYYSTKNNQTMTVHTEPAKAYADSLEKNFEVKSYKTCELLDIEQYTQIPTIGLRKSILQGTWTTDFVIHLQDGNTAIRELSYRRDFLRMMNLQKLEFSRRYWASLGIMDWKIILI